MIDLAVADAPCLHHAVAVEPVPISELADFVSSRAVAEQRAFKPRRQPPLQFGASDGNSIFVRAFITDEPRSFGKSIPERFLPRIRSDDGICSASHLGRCGANGVREGGGKARRSRHRLKQIATIHGSPQ